MSVVFEAALKNTRRSRGIPILANVICGTSKIISEFRITCKSYQAPSLSLEYNVVFGFSALAFSSCPVLFPTPLALPGAEEVFWLVADHAKEQGDLANLGQGLFAWMA